MKGGARCAIKAGGRELKMGKEEKT